MVGKGVCICRIAFCVLLLIRAKEKNRRSGWPFQWGEIFSFLCCSRLWKLEKHNVHPTNVAYIDWNSNKSVRPIFSDIVVSEFQSI